MLRTWMQDNIIGLFKDHTREMPADIMTKVLPEVDFAPTANP